MSPCAHAATLAAIKRASGTAEAQKGGVVVIHPNPTGYGWFVRLPNGQLVEVATDEEAYELLAELES